MKKITVLFFLLLSIFCFSQEDEIDFSIRYLPNKQYLKQTENTIAMQVIDKKEAKNNKNIEPQKSKSLYNITTGSLKPDQTFNVSMKMEINSNAPNLVGIVFRGYYDENKKIQFKSIENKSFTEEQKKQVLETLQAIVNSFDIPDKKMKIGESVQTTSEVNIPIFGNTSMNFAITTTYILKSLKGKNAFFDYTQTISMQENKNEKMSIECSGSGKGIMVYDSQQHFPTETRGDFLLNFNISIGDEKAEMKMQMNTNEKVTINDFIPTSK